MGPRTVLRGLSDGAPPLAPVRADPLVVFAGRLIPEKRAPLGVEAVALAAQRVAGLEAIFYGEGPERGALDAAIARCGVKDTVSAPGWAERETLERDMRRALCVLLPSRREGYGLVVVEASAKATPSVVVAAEDNAATELVEDGVNGVVARDGSAEGVAAAIGRVSEMGMALRESTAKWYTRNAHELSIESSLEAVLESYRGGAGSPASAAPDPSPPVTPPPSSPAVQEAGTSDRPSARA